MTWKLNKEAKAWSPIPGVPWRDMDDDEFKEVCAEYDKQFPDAPKSLERWFTHEKKKGGG